MYDLSLSRGFASPLTQRHEHAADAGDAPGGHGGEEDPPSAPLVHDVPAHEVGGDLHRRADEEAQKGVDVEICGVEAEPVVHHGVGEPVERDQDEVSEDEDEIVR